jgi:hypothetical protein
MNNETILAVVAVLVLGLLEAFALSKGINGTLFALVSALIAGIAGYKAQPFIDAARAKITGSIEDPKK